MTSSVFVLTIQIERRQCYLSALAQEKIATSVPTMMPVASLVCCFDTRLLPCASFAFICFHLLPSSGGGAPHSLSVSILSLTANLAPVQQTGFCNAGLSLVSSGGASQSSSSFGSSSSALAENWSPLEFYQWEVWWENQIIMSASGSWMRLCVLLAPQSSALSRLVFRFPSHTQCHPLWAFKPEYTEAFKPVSGSLWQSVLVSGSLWYPRCYIHAVILGCQRSFLPSCVLHIMTRFLNIQHCSSHCSHYYVCKRKHFSKCRLCTFHVLWWTFVHQ